ncbi:MAG: hypothetical protein MI919_08260, partial [Holophagales bacterium]|nr:hypothetical protein [Holophagales bacterium]
MEFVRSESDRVAQLDPAAADPAAVDPGAVEAFEILEEQTVGADIEPCVSPGRAGQRDHHVVGFGAADSVEARGQGMSAVALIHRPSQAVTEGSVETAEPIASFQHGIPRMQLGVLGFDLGDIELALFPPDALDFQASAFGDVVEGHHGRQKPLDLQSAHPGLHLTLAVTAVPKNLDEAGWT